MPQILAPSPFRIWREDLERREFQYLMDRQPKSGRVPEYRFGLTQEDGVFLGQIDRAFEDER